MNEAFDGAPKIVLASISPRRRRLLGLLGLSVQVVPSAVDESCVGGDSPMDFAQNAAREKCMDVASNLDHPSLVLGADTVVCLSLDDADLASPDFELPGFRVFDQHRELILGKPSGPEEAAAMLRWLSGRTHRVITGVALAQGGDKANLLELNADTTHVQFCSLNEKEIWDYVATGEPLDKAGSYGVQGLGARFIGKVVGDLSNVIGLPLPVVIAMLKPFFGELQMPDESDLKEEAYRR